MSMYDIAQNGIFINLNILKSNFPKYEVKPQWFLCVASPQQSTIVSSTEKSLAIGPNCSNVD